MQKKKKKFKSILSEWGKGSHDVNMWFSILAAHQPHCRRYFKVQIPAPTTDILVSWSRVGVQILANFKTLIKSSSTARSDDIWNRKIYHVFANLPLTWVPLVKYKNFVFFKGDLTRLPLPGSLPVHHTLHPCTHLQGHSGHGLSPRSSSGGLGIWTPVPLPNFTLHGDVPKQRGHIRSPKICTKNGSCLSVCLGCFQYVSSPYPPQALGLWKEESVHPQGGSLQSSRGTPLSLPGPIQRCSDCQNYGGRCGWAPGLQQTGLHPADKRRCSDKHDNRLSHSPRSRCCQESSQVSILLQPISFRSFSQMLCKYHLKVRKLILFFNETLVSSWKTTLNSIFTLLAQNKHYFSSSINLKKHKIWGGVPKWSIGGDYLTWKWYKEIQQNGLEFFFKALDLSKSSMERVLWLLINKTPGWVCFSSIQGPIM